VSRYGQIRIAAVAVTNLNGAASPPCGACRQVLSEFAAGTTPMVFAGENGPVETTLAALLPFGFRLGSG
jgi:cytidine deaminase